MVPGRDVFQGENGKECVVELELAEKHYCNYLLMAVCKNIFSEGEQVNKKWDQKQVYFWDTKVYKGV